jgi:hypothetical protein
VGRVDDGLGNLLALEHADEIGLPAVVKMRFGLVDHQHRADADGVPRTERDERDERAQPRAALIKPGPLSCRPVTNEQMQRSVVGAERDVKSE